MTRIDKQVAKAEGSGSRLREEYQRLVTEFATFRNEAARSLATLEQCNREIPADAWKTPATFGPDCDHS